MAALENGTVSGVPSAPLQISVSSRSADYITVTWQHPLLMHPTDKLKYKYGCASEIRPCIWSLSLSQYPGSTIA